MTRSHWTLATLLALGGTAAADGIEAAPQADEMITVTGAESRRGVAEDYLVMPSGGELDGQMKFIMADQGLAGRPLKFSDLGVFGIAGRWSVFDKLELSASVDLVPKQPSYTSEKPWQDVGFGIRSPLGHHVALALQGGGGHLLDSTGMWTHESLMLEWKKPIDREFLAFDVRGGIDGLGLQKAQTQGAFMTEVAVSTSAMFREPSGHWGAWLGIGYAVPVQKSGMDPTTGLAIDPQPRLDFHVGTVLAIVKEWDLFADFAVIDRGDASNPATELPILDGGFDQKQIIFGVTRHITVEHHHDDDGDAMELGSL